MRFWSGFAASLLVGTVLPTWYLPYQLKLTALAASTCIIAHPSRGTHGVW